MAQHKFGTCGALCSVSSASLSQSWATRRATPIVAPISIREVRMSAEALNGIAVTVVLAVAGMLCAPAAQAQQPLDKVSFGTNWVAEGEHGGHYQALVDGTYKRYGLDVTIV